MTVHHVRRGHHVRPGGGVADGNLSQMRQGFIVVYLVTMEDAAVPVVRILAHADVGNDGKVRIPGLDGPHGLLNDPVFRPGGGAAGVLFRGEAEEDAVLHAVGQTLLHGEAHAVQAVVVLARQALGSVSSATTGGPTNPA